MRGMKGIRCVIIQGKRALVSWRFLAACLGIAAVMYTTGYPYLDGAESIVDAVGVWGFVRGTGIFIMTLAIFPLLPFSLSYAEEYNDKALHFWSIRMGIKTYVGIKFVVALLTAGMSYMIGSFGCLLLYWIRVPLFLSVTSGDAYAILLEKERVVLYLVFLFIHFSLSAAFFSGLSMCISVYFPKKFAALMLPMVGYLFLGRMGSGLPRYLNLFGYIEGTVNAGTPAISLLLKLVITIILLLVLGYCTIEKAERRSQND